MSGYVHCAYMGCNHPVPIMGEGDGADLCDACEEAGCEPSESAETCAVDWCYGPEGADPCGCVSKDCDCPECVGEGEET